MKKKLDFFISMNFLFQKLDRFLDIYKKIYFLYQEMDFFLKQKIDFLVHVSINTE